MRTSLRFILSGQIEELANGDPTQTVLEYLREHKGLCGTKEGCAEGDCGACTVVIGELVGDSMRYQAVNSCIQLLPSLDGKQLICVEDLAVPQSNTASPAGVKLHAVQQAMVDQHGSQCGFCTPGFVMSLFSMFHHQSEQAASREQIELGLAGNLCRCTGYAPILRAAQQTLNADRSDHFDQHHAEHVSQLKRIQSEQDLAYTDLANRRQFYAPRSMESVCKLLHETPDSTLVAGATDVGLWVTKKLQQLPTVIYLGNVTELLQCEHQGEYLIIGAAVSYTDASDHLCAAYPGLQPLINRIGGTQVRNAGTIGGNIGNGSPIGDMPPALIALGAKLVICSLEGQREIDLQDFFIEYSKQDLRRGECIQQIKLPLPNEQQLFATYKVSKRFEQDISALCGAFALTIEDGQIKDARICFGGMAGIPKRASHCEAAIIGQPFLPDTIKAGMLAMRADYTPMSDMRASANYRMQVAQNLLQRFYLENSDVDYMTQLGSPGAPATEPSGQVANDGGNPS